MLLQNLGAVARLFVRRSFLIAASSESLLRCILLAMKTDQFSTRKSGDRFASELVRRVDESRLVDIDPATRELLRIFLLDTLAVGVAGRCNPHADGVFNALSKAHGGPGECAVLAREGTGLPPHAAAVVNGFQIHCLEWDGLHEPSVVIALCTTMSALVSEIQMRPNVTLDEVLLALAVGVETSVFFGAGSASAPRFFRPSAAGVMGAAMALGKLRGLSASRLPDLLGLAYSQVGGTMQAHWEGSEALALQVGFAARAALTAADLAEAGIGGPHEVVAGKFGYFTLIETAGDIAGALASWGAPWKISDVAHKPFPAGRATQSVLTAIMDLRREKDFEADDILSVHAKVPPLIGLLVNRPYGSEMTPAYARLCLQFVIARMLLDRGIDPRHFTQAFFAQPEVAALAPLITCSVDDNPDPNAMSPQTIEVTLRDGLSHSVLVEHPLGSPGRRLDDAQRAAKVAQCFEAGGFARDPQEFVDLCMTLPGSAPAMNIIRYLKGE